MDLSNYKIDDLNKNDLSLIDWSGSAAHIRNVSTQLERVKLGEAEYLAIRDSEGNPVAKGLIDHVRREGGSEIGQMATHPDLQGKGLGTLLIAEAEKRILTHGHPLALLGVEVSNTRAKKLYERLGYTAYGSETDSWIAEDETGSEQTYFADVILMRKEIGV